MAEEQNNLENIRHSLAHLLAMAVLKEFPTAKLGVGPVVEHGFYYDFLLPEALTPAHLKTFQTTMRKLVSQNLAFERGLWPMAKALEYYKDQPFKLELIKEKSDGINVQVYKTGSFIDFCKGGHVENTKEIDAKAFCLTTVAGAYWKGDEQREQLQRVYGVAFTTPEELKQYLAQVEEAKKRDHRKIAADMDLFTISEEVGPGLVLWLPKGNIIKEELEQWAKQTEEKWGYSRVTTPHITKAGLFYTSGHLPYYKDDMYPPMKLDEHDEYFLKPMNCPFHHMIFKARPRSYKELPLRLAEFGTCYRYESSGELFGLMRVRGFTQNDAHIYCTLDQAVDEFIEVMKLHEYFYQALGIKKYHLVLALRDPKNTKKYHGNEAMWQLAEKLMREAVSRTKLEMVEDIGGAAFYGPKIDFVVHSSIGREFAVSTNQIDLFMGERFKLKYHAKDGSEQVPAIIHRAPLGSHERFIGFLIEHYAGAFPLWLAPVQVAVLPIAEASEPYARQIMEQLTGQYIRGELMAASETLNKRIREAEQQKIPYLVVVGEKEMNDKTVSVRGRGRQDLGSQPVDQFITLLKEKIATRA